MKLATTGSSPTIKLTSDLFPVLLAIAVTVTSPPSATLIPGVTSTAQYSVPAMVRPLSLNFVSSFITNTLSETNVTSSLTMVSAANGQPFWSRALKSM